MLGLHAPPAIAPTINIALHGMAHWYMHCRVVPDLLRAILPLLPLEKASTGKKDKASNSSSGKQPPPKRWDIVNALQKLGTGHASLELPSTV